LDALREWLSAQAMQAPFWAVIAATIAWFALIYLLITGGAHALTTRPVIGALAPGGRLRPRQVRQELRLSLLSILIFAAQAAGLVWVLRHGWLAIDWQRSFWNLLWELPLLYLWNELHFFIVHRALHWKPLYRRLHIWHHRSVITTPFSAYSFHPVESFLLGSVMPLALVFHAFSPWALLGLTVMSLLLNVAGHLPHEHIRNGFGLLRAHSAYHNRHHREFHTHYAFSLVWLDRWLGGAKPVKM
jgi:Delta7-sterol 5-desaturase